MNNNLYFNKKEFEGAFKKYEEMLKRRRIDRIEETAMNTIYLCILIIVFIYLSWCTFKQVTYLLDIKKNKSNNFYESILGLICLIYFIILFIYFIYDLYNNLTMYKINEAFNYYFME
jgi:TRAP-type C4-dicarboxylate transport system permease small subunit